MLYLPILFRGVGMMVIFIAFGVFVVEDLDPRLTLSNAFFLISFRSVLAPVLSASFFNNMLYYLQAKGMNILSENMTLTNPLAEQKYNQALSNGTNSARPDNWQPTVCTPLCSSNPCCLP